MSFLSLLPSRVRAFVAWVGCLVFFASLLCSAADSETPDRSLSPYFRVKASVPAQSGDSMAGETDLLPLKTTDVRVTIAGVFAEVCVTQRYANAGTVPLEAVYVFPGSTRAAVHSMQMTIGDRRLVARGRISI